MATLYKYKCKECGYTINSSQDGDYTLMSGPGHFYKCSECNCVFTKVWARWDMDVIAKDYSFLNDEHLVDLLKNMVPEEFQEALKRDVSWFQQEVKKGTDSIYYGKTITHDAVIWTEEKFGVKLLKFLQRKDYAKSIKFASLKVVVKEPRLKKYAAYINSTHHVKCYHCNGNAFPWSSSCGCPRCGNTMEKQNCIMLVD